MMQLKHANTPNKQKTNIYIKNNQPRWTRWKSS